ncbi:ATP-binding cassette domain-containing protein [Streptomyces sp. 3213.3]|uniref:ATP-binding cassette domain-containing protein n=1 Tax=Streptomyces sp. 3213.3 TaxID=1855348 RepID=UPI002E0F3933
MVAHAGRAAVIGPSGSGRTTLVRTLDPLEQPDAGSVEINGRLMGGRWAAGTVNSPPSGGAWARSSSGSTSSRTGPPCKTSPSPRSNSASTRAGWPPRAGGLRQLRGTAPGTLLRGDRSRARGAAH